MTNNPLSFYLQMQQLLRLSQHTVTEAKFIPEIQKVRQHSETKIYNLFTADTSVYFRQIWNFLAENDPQIEQQVLLPLNKRINNVIDDINDKKIYVEEKAPLMPYDYEEQLKNNKLSSLRYHSSRLKRKANDSYDNIEGLNTSKVAQTAQNSYKNMFSEEKRKEIEEFVKGKRREQYERKKRQNQAKKKELQYQIKKNQQEKFAQKKSLEAKREQALKLQKQKQDKREKEKMLREQRNSQYIRLKQNMHEKPPLYKKIFNTFNKRSQQYETLKREKAIQEKKSIFVPLKKQQFEEHNRRYSELKMNRNKQRLQRVHMQLQQERSRVKFYSSYQIHEKDPDPDEVQKLLAKAKMARIQEYKALVKQKFPPTIDEEKKKELMNIMQEMQLAGKPVKKVKLENGSVIYEELREGDPKIRGMQNLALVKQLASKYKKVKKPIEESQSNELKKPKDYLEEMKKKRLRNRSYDKDSNYIQSKNISYDEKLKKVLHESDKLAEQTRQTEMMLKYGKFKTSQEILTCKQEIDKNYIDIVNMKLKLFQNQTPQ